MRSSGAVQQDWTHDFIFICAMSATRYRLPLHHRPAAGNRPRANPLETAVNQKTHSESNECTMTVQMCCAYIMVHSLSYM